MSLHGPHFMSLQSIYVLYSNVTYIYPASNLVEIKLFQIVKIFGISVKSQAAGARSSVAGSEVTCLALACTPGSEGETGTCAD